MADFPTYTDPTIEQAQTSTDYTTGVGQIDQQAALNEQTYAQNRASTIRSFQDTLDNLSFGLKQAGLQARGAYAGRNLYNASGELSGTGQLVGTELTQPIVRQITSAQQGHEANLQRLGTTEAQGRLNIATAKQDLLKTVLTNLTTKAKERYNVGVDSYNAGIKAQKEIADAKKEEEKAALEKSKLPGGEIDTLKLKQDQESKGRTHLKQADLAGAKAKYGSDALIKVGNMTFLLSSSERLDLAKAKKDLNKSPKEDNDTSVDVMNWTDKKLKSDYQLSLQGLGGNVQTKEGQPGVTRETAITKLFKYYNGRVPLADIQRDVYTQYPD